MLRGNQEFKGNASWNSDGGTSGIFMHYNSTNSHQRLFRLENVYS